MTHSGERGASRAMKYLLVELRRNNNAKHIEWKLQDSGAFSREHHDDREKQETCVSGLIFRYKVLPIPRLPFRTCQNLPRRKNGDEWNARINTHAFGNIANRHVNGEFQFRQSLREARIAAVRL